MLAVDADPNTCLDAALGVRAEKTVGRIREEARRVAAKGMAAGLSKQEFLEFKIAECLVEAQNFDLIAMGRSEGPGCYCYANNVLKDVLGRLSGEYPYVVLDNEAGLENLSRRIVQKADLMLMTTDLSRRGLETVRRLHTLGQEMQIGYERLAVVVNRSREGELPAPAGALKEELGADIVLALPEDEQIAQASEAGESLLLLGAQNNVCARIDVLLSEMGVV